MGFLPSTVLTSPGKLCPIRTVVVNTALIINQYMVTVPSTFTFVYINTYK